MRHFENPVLFFDGPVDCMTLSDQYVYFGMYWDGMYRADNSPTFLPLTFLQRIDGEVLGIHASPRHVVCAGWRSLGIYSTNGDERISLIDERLWGDGEEVGNLQAHERKINDIYSREQKICIDHFAGHDDNIMILTECDDDRSSRGKIVLVNLGLEIQVNDLTPLLGKRAIDSISHFSLQNNDTAWMVCRFAEKWDANSHNVFKRCLIRIDIGSMSLTKFLIPESKHINHERFKTLASLARQDILFLNNTLLMPDQDRLLVFNEDLSTFEQIFADPDGRNIGFYSICKGHIDDSIFVGTEQGVALLEFKDIQGKDCCEIAMKPFITINDFDEQGGAVHSLAMDEEALWIGASTGLYRCA
jgi:hypothetical protein